MGLIYLLLYTNIISMPSKHHFPFVSLYKNSVQILLLSLDSYVQPTHYPRHLANNVTNNMTRNNVMFLLKTTKPVLAQLCGSEPLS